MTKDAANHAKQLFNIARLADYLEEARVELNGLLLAIEEQPKFMELLTAPHLDIDQKKALVISTFSKEYSKLMVDFLVILVEEKAVMQLKEIGNHFHHLVSQHLADYFGVVEGTVYSAVPLSESQLLQLTYVFTKQIGKKIKLKLEIDESLIGGYKVNIANMVYDSTIKLQLKQLRASLMNGDLE